MYKMLFAVVTGIAVLSTLSPLTPVVWTEQVNPTPVASSVAHSPFDTYKNGAEFTAWYKDGTLFFNDNNTSFNIDPDQFYDPSGENYSAFYIDRNGIAKKDKLMIMDMPLDSWSTLADGSLVDCWIKTVDEPDYGEGV